MLVSRRSPCVFSMTLLFLEFLSNYKIDCGIKVGRWKQDFFMEAAIDF